MESVASSAGMKSLHRYEDMAPQR